jgi:hypothetical protein
MESRISEMTYHPFKIRSAREAANVTIPVFIIESRSVNDLVMP